jgi:hypothetical protein
MKSVLVSILSLSFLVANSIGQDIVTTRSGVVVFFSSAPLEDIKATNKRVRAVMNTSTGEILVRVQIKDFEFSKSLMQKHFNDEYMESHIYPEAQLTGTIHYPDSKKITQSPIDVVLKGNMTIHGVTQTFQTNGNIQKRGERIICEAIFTINVADYNVKIPKLLIRNIAETVEVTVKLDLE